MNMYNAKNENIQRGASLLEVILSIALSLMLVPFMYVQISDMNNAVKDIAIANRIVKSRDGIVNYVRVNQATFSGAGTPLYAHDLENIAPGITSMMSPIKIENNEPVAWVFKTDAQGAEITEVFLAFTIGSDYQTANIAKYIGNDAAVVSIDQNQNLVAYSQNWAIGISEDFYFYPGDLIFRIAHDFGGDDKNKFLHRGTIGGDNLNQMQRDLHMNNFNIFNIAKITGNNIFANVTHTEFFRSDTINATTIYFKAGAGLKTNDAVFRALYVKDDLVNFAEINTKKLEATEIESKDTTIDSAVNVITTDTGALGDLILGGKSSSNKLIFETVKKAIEVFAGYVNTSILIFTNEIMVSNNIKTSMQEGDSGAKTRFEFSYVWKWPNPDNPSKPSAPTIERFIVQDINAADVLDIEANYYDSGKFDVVYSEGWYK